MPLTPVSESELLAAAGTHPGESGKNNEDNYALAFFRASNGDPVTLAVVADGVGGNRAGEIASSLTVRAIVEEVAQSEGTDYVAVLTRAIQQATAVLAEHSRIFFEYVGMGTTCAVALVRARRLYTTYVGDSRLYLLRRGQFQQISIDHTWLQAAVDRKLISAEEAASHPNQHVLLRYIGGRVNAKPDFRLILDGAETAEQSEANQGLLLESGDAVLVCSDGLSDLVTNNEISAVVREYRPQVAVEQLITLARQRGGHDNITVIVLRVP
ncbi:MAG: protein phosphatase 2C domain-containing protein [Anaerolineales bacterium]|nr:protein phosphatase 2C domain-containing protein [Anaerolineales bacterium]